MTKRPSLLWEGMSGSRERGRKREKKREKKRERERLDAAHHSRERGPLKVVIIVSLCQAWKSQRGSWPVLVRAAFEKS